MAFFQDPPQLANQYDDDRVLRSYLGRVLGPELLRAHAEELTSMGELAGGELAKLQLADRRSEPKLTQWDAWGRRVDRLELTPLWKRVAPLAAERGLLAIPYERKQGALSRVLQLALVHLFGPSSDFYTCPLAASDGAAKALVFHRNQPLIDRALPRLTSRDPRRFWTSGQWMTERTGGSDVGLSETVARRVEGGWRLYGTKWFTSAIQGEMSLTLGRPEGNGRGGRGLALFYVELRDAQGNLQGVQLNRLKEKLGSRMLPTAELTLDGLPATPVVGLDGGIKNITPMLVITRLWNAVCAAADMRRAVALARDYARRRVAFGARLADKPLHQEVLADLQAEAEAGFHLAFRCAELVGREEANEASDRDRLTLRLLMPLAKLVTGKQVVQVASEAIEACGGAGYIEDTGLPRLLRDAQLYPIWEGATNVLALDVLRAIGDTRDGDALVALLEEGHELAAAARAPALLAATEAAMAALERAAERVGRSRERDRDAGMRGVALTLGRSFGLLLLCRQAQWSLDHEQDARAAASALRFRGLGIDLLREPAGYTGALGNDEPLPAASL